MGPGGDLVGCALQFFGRGRSLIDACGQLGRGCRDAFGCLLLLGQGAGFLALHLGEAGSGLDRFVGDSAVVGCAVKFFDERHVRLLE